MYVPCVVKDYSKKDEIIWNVATLVLLIYLLIFHFTNRVNVQMMTIIEGKTTLYVNVRNSIAEQQTCGHFCVKISKSAKVVRNALTCELITLRWAKRRIKLGTMSVRWKANFVWIQVVWNAIRVVNSFSHGFTYTTSVIKSNLIEQIKITATSYHKYNILSLFTAVLDFVGDEIIYHFNYQFETIKRFWNTG